MNRQEKAIQLAMCLALAILAAQNIGAHSIWVSGMAFVCIFEKKIFSIMRGYVNKTQTNNKRLDDTELRLASLKDKTYQGLRCLNNRINSHSELLSHYQARIRIMENTLTEGPQSAEAPTTSPPRPQNSQARHSPPAANTRSRATATEEHAYENVPTTSRNVTFNLRYGSPTAPIVEQKFYFQCELCGKEEFLSYKNYSPVCEGCKPPGARNKVIFVKIAKPEIFYFCACEDCRSGAYTRCAEAQCIQCTESRRQPERTNAPKGILEQRLQKS